MQSKEQLVIVEQYRHNFEGKCLLYCTSNFSATGHAGFSSYGQAQRSCPDLLRLHDMCSRKISLIAFGEIMQKETQATQSFWATVRQEHPDYMRWFISDTISALGTALCSIPLSLASLHITHDLTRAGLVAAATSLGSMLMVIPSGMIIDHFDKKKLLRCYGITQLSLWSLFTLLLATHAFTTPTLLLFAFCTGITNGIFGGLNNAILRFIITENLFVQAQGRNQTRDSTIWLCGLPLGGLLYNICAPLPFLCQALSGLAPLWAGVRITTSLAPTH
ncbi:MULTISPECIES: MFS transporter [unclassified Corynebacterium]|uniref:MFS transporter n=1 Tax=unclassified Corynebacterium TaxID=2624378 RepID=UPI0021035493|nr:MFS transporter [Corynebacterium sp. SY003]